MTEIKDLLSDLDFPASKQQIVEHTRGRGGPGTAAERALAALPLGDYANRGEVLRSVPSDPGPPRTSPSGRISRGTTARPGWPKAPATASCRLSPKS